MGFQGWGDDLTSCVLRSQALTCDGGWGASAGLNVKLDRFLGWTGWEAGRLAGRATGACGKVAWGVSRGGVRTWKLAGKQFGGMRFGETAGKKVVWGVSQGMSRACGKAVASSSLVS